VPNEAPFIVYNFLLPNWGSHLGCRFRYVSCFNFI